MLVKYVATAALLVHVPCGDLDPPKLIVLWNTKSFQSFPRDLVHFTPQTSKKDVSPPSPPPPPQKNKKKRVREAPEKCFDVQMIL